MGVVTTLTHCPHVVEREAPDFLSRVSHAHSPRGHAPRKGKNKFSGLRPSVLRRVTCRPSATLLSDGTHCGIFSSYLAWLQLSHPEKSERVHASVFGAYKLGSFLGFFSLP